MSTTVVLTKPAQVSHFLVVLHTAMVQPGKKNEPREAREARESKEVKKQEADEKKRGFQPWLGEERPLKRLELDLDKYIGKQVEVQMTGNRVYRGYLQSHDLGMNLVLNNTTEAVEGKEPRAYGTVVVRGPMVQSLAPIAV